MKKNNFLEIFNKRSLKYGSISFVLIAAVIAIAVLLNVMVGALVTNFNLPLKWDLTPNKLYSISDTTTKILKDMKKDVEIIGLFDDEKTQEYKDVVQLLNHYTKYSNIKLKFIDPDKNPTVIKDYDASGILELSKNDFIVKSGKKIRKLGYYDLFTTEMNEQTFQPSVTGTNAEQGFTGAIKYVTSDVTPVVYFLEGHGEGSLTGEYSSIKGDLEKNNFDVKSLNLLTQSKVPDDAEMIIATSPKNDISFAEKDKLNAYMKDGGKALFMFDFLANNPQFSNFEDIMKAFNVGINYDKVKENDQNRHFTDNPYGILLDVQSNEVVSNAFQMVLFDSRSVSILKNQKEYIKVTSLMQTGEKAEGEQMDKARGANNQGPLDIAVASVNQGGSKESRLVVMGNSTFISDSAQQTYGVYFETGRFFLITTLNWMLDQKDENIIAPKAFENPTITISEGQFKGMGGVVVIIVPLLILGAGLTVYLRRRHL